jgi:3-mercaptopyruvate sulfurtransferase SseA
VTAAWLHQHLACVKVVDASWFMPNVARDPKAEYISKRLPAAVFLDLDAVSDRTSEPAAASHQLNIKRPFESLLHFKEPN